MARYWLTVFCLCASALVAAQEPRDGSSAAPATSPAITAPAAAHPKGTAPTFRSGVDMVALTVTVTDKNHLLVPDLALDDFAVFEDGVRQEISLFSGTRAPLDLAIVLDTSSSITDLLTTAQEAAIGFARSLHPGDRLMVIQVQDRADILHPLDADISGAIESISRTTARGSTALFNGLYLTLSDMKKRARADEIRRQVIVVLSDGQDTHSLVRYDDVLDVAKDSGIAIYSIALQEPPTQVPMPTTSLFARPKSFVEPQYVMRSFAMTTGGRYFVATDGSQLSGIYNTIADELAHQYSLGYVSTNARHDGTFRTITVRVVNQRECAARTRSGYRAPRFRPPARTSDDYAR